MSFVIVLRGGAALSEFRRRRQLEQIRRIESQVVDLQSWYLHFVVSETRLSDPDRARVLALLDDGSPATAAADAQPTLWVVPRIGTVSPWASKATEIARVCGLHAVQRIERGVAYAVQTRRGLLGGAQPLAPPQL
ncbi:MAG TPA: hypothetical protein VM491_06885 [Burkholderiaceae bacterium]|nr:hypothetical protein [Burkholderiaceae bacterium]